jgi:hypothetical protein
VVVIAVFAWTCGGLPTGSPGSNPTGGPPAGDAAVNVRGTIDRGGATPSCPPGEPCDPPIVAMFLDFSQPGRPDIRVRVGAGGAFALHLDPGTYSISAAPALNGKLDPDQVRVPSSGTVDLHLVVRPPA